MFPGDEIVVCYGNRYAPDQFEAVIGEDLGPCDLVAGGGIASRELSRHDRMIEPTRITPIGLLGDQEGRRLNVRDVALPPRTDGATTMLTVLSLGTSMNAGKTLTGTSMVHGLKRAGYRVAAIKATGTGSGGDLWIVRDAGADLVLDFTDAGFASTYLAPVADLEAATLSLIAHAAADFCDVAVIEIADGLQQLETAALVRSEVLRSKVAGVTFAAYDAMGAKCGVDLLHALGHRVLGVSGRLSRSPLAVRETEQSTGIRVYTPWELQAGALVPTIMAGIGGPKNAGIQIRPVPPLGSTGDLTASEAHLDRSRQNSVGADPGNSAESNLRLQKEILSLAARSVLAHEADRFSHAHPDARRNGSRRRIWSSCLGPIELSVPRFRGLSFRPAIFTLGPEQPDVFWDAVGEATRNGNPRRLVRLIGGPDMPEADLAALGAAIALRCAAAAPAVLSSGQQAGVAAIPQAEYASVDEAPDVGAVGVDELDRPDDWAGWWSGAAATMSAGRSRAS
ncbi:MAG: hypothetical protein KDA73_15460 [Rhodobacteraceae bacterium]|nr:hypothetical protein [Paracoccaceae bacterium]